MFTNSVSKFRQEFHWSPVKQFHQFSLIHRRRIPHPILHHVRCYDVKNGCQRGPPRPESLSLCTCCYCCPRQFLAPTSESDHTCLARQKRQKREKRALQLDHPPTEERGGTRNTISAKSARAMALRAGVWPALCGHIVFQQKRR